MQPSPYTIHLRPVFVVLALGCSTVFLIGPLAAAVLVAVFAPANVSTYLVPGMIGFVGVMTWAMSSSVQWVELNDGVLRARVGSSGEQSSFTGSATSSP
ncbi:hypothetical protein R5W23_004105 [Gemmata sp. JC673]|uniref:Uncharacterized protein n=1 Tax=Gemmata algarum TaxID=2975278 RepID=A0ABU5F618_9BACT|nr:hypothetical protein [Gemmata algarum]MDY3562639.1 hypothetical protein [Gemmata algarum]